MDYIHPENLALRICCDALAHQVLSKPRPTPKKFRSKRATTTKDESKPFIENSNKEADVNSNTMEESGLKEDSNKRKNPEPNSPLMSQIPLFQPKDNLPPLNFLFSGSKAKKGKFPQEFPESFKSLDFPRLTCQKETFQEGPDRQVVGIDEVGRGPIAGPLVLGFCMIKYPISEETKQLLEECRDSKTTAKNKRLAIAERLLRNPELVIHLEFASHIEVDNMNVDGATFFHMRMGTQYLKQRYLALQQAIMDGEKKTDLCVECTNQVKGDAWYPSISAAAIVAKVARDQYMELLDKKMGGIYDFTKNSGYCQGSHEEALLLYGVSEYHRRTYEPVASLLHGTYEKYVQDRAQKKQRKSHK